MILLHELTEEQLCLMIESAVTKAMNDMFDETWTRQDVADHFKVSLTTVNKWIRTGEIVRTNPGSGHPKFSKREVTMKHRKL